MTELAVDLDLSVAYDGCSKRRQRRALKPLERDVLTRILSDIIHELHRDGNLDHLLFVCKQRGIRMDAREVPMLVNIRRAIDPRSDDG